MKTEFPKTFSMPPALRPLSIAFVYGRMPLPMTRGDQLTVAHLLSFLKSRGHAVTLYATAAPDEMKAEVVDWLNSVCESQIVVIKPIQRMASLFFGILARLPAQVAFFTSTGISKRLEAAIELNKHDVIYTYYVRSAQTTLNAINAAGRAVPSVLALQLSQGLNTERMGRDARNVVSKLLYSLENSLVKTYESWIWRCFDRTIFVARKDYEYIARVCSERGLPVIDNHMFLPHGVDIEKFGQRYDDPKEEIVLFAGGLSYYPNELAALWLAREVWPRIRLRRPGAKLIIAGRKPRAPVLALAGLDGVIVKADVPDMAEEIRGATVCVNTVRAAAGMQNKLIEYLAGRKATVSTSFANEGIGAVANEHLLIADEEESVSNAVLSLLENPPLRHRLAAAGRLFVERNWTWEAWFLRLEHELTSLAGKQPSDTPAERPD